MFIKRLAVPKKRSLRQYRLARWTFIHTSMAGSYRTDCKIIERHENGMVTIEYYDFVTKDTERTKRVKDDLSFQ